MKEKLVFVWSPRPLDTLWLASWEHSFQYILQDLVINLCPCTLLQTTLIGTNFCLCTPSLFKRVYNSSQLIAFKWMLEMCPRCTQAFSKFRNTPEHIWGFTGKNLWSSSSDPNAWKEQTPGESPVINTGDKQIPSQSLAGFTGTGCSCSSGCSRM